MDPRRASGLAMVSKAARIRRTNRMGRQDRGHALPRRSERRWSRYPRDLAFHNIERAELTPLVIVGGGGWGREIAELVEAINAHHHSYEVRGFLADGYHDALEIERLGMQYLGNVEAGLAASDA